MLSEMMKGRDQANPTESTFEMMDVRTRRQAGFVKAAGVPKSNPATLKGQKSMAIKANNIQSFYYGISTQPPPKKA